MMGSYCVVGRNMGAAKVQTHPVSEEDFAGFPRIRVASREFGPDGIDAHGTYASDAVANELH
ncbi:MAG: hypothetical protein JOY90_14255 [Bradyrhizobium sp.]|uniref:hypothetical protein n=1 Tax=Bradyrhizobium sp. TaxID=376 RepID=UPI001DE680DE|nr:hypothetical protein [Bradyrhizobium sp.]MBV9561592.1 hypothetical protein [Bradyrhizobium sp.]